MTQEPNPTPRPTDPFTAQDGARLFNEVSKRLDSLNSSISIAQGTLANLLNKQIAMLEQMTRIEAGLSGSRVTRFEQEILEAKLELDKAEQAKKTAEEKLRLKNTLKENNLDTQERIEKIVENQWEDLEKQKKAEQEAFKKDVLRGAIKYVVNGLAMGATLGILGFLYWLFTAYVNRGGP